MEDQRQQRSLAILVDKLTDKNKDGSDDHSGIHKLKLTCKQGGDEISSNAFALILEKLRAPNSKTRLYALELLRVLVPRSACVRTLVAHQLTEVLELVLGFRSKSLPPPSKEASTLRDLGLESLERWSEDYGNSLQQFRMGFQYLKDVVKMKFPEINALQAVREADAAARQERTRKINLEKYSKLCETYLSTIADIQITIDELDAAYAILRIPDEEQEEVENEWEDVPGSTPKTNSQALESGASPSVDKADISSSLDPLCSREDGANAAEPDIKIVDVKDIDQELLSHMRGLYKLLCGRHLSNVQDWLKLIMKIDVGTPGSSEHSRREAVLRKAIKTRDDILGCRTQYDRIMKAIQKAEEDGGRKPDEMVINAIAGPDGNKQHIQVASRTATSSHQQAVSEQTSQAPKAKQAGAVQNLSEAQILQAVFGSDSDDEGPPQKAATRSPANKLAMLSLRGKPKHKPTELLLDPTYSKPVLSPPARPASLKKTNPSGEVRERIHSGNIPAELKAKLIKEAPSVPTGNHLAYWDSDKASLMNNKGMEFYNHWGAVDESVPLPDDVISKFFTTRATYYEPSKDTKKRPRQPSPVEEEPLPEPAPKRPTPVTKIGLETDVTAPLKIGKLPIPKLEKFVPPPRRYTKSDTPSQDTAAAASTDPMADQNRSIAAGNSNIANSSIRAEFSHQEGRDRGLVSPGVVAQRKGHAKSVAAANDTATEKQKKEARRLTDRQHNERILAGSHYKTDEEQQAKAKKEKSKPSVRDRLAQKLLNNKAVDRVVGDLDAIENEHFKDLSSHQWQNV